MSTSQTRHDSRAPTAQAAPPPWRVRLRPLVIGVLGGAALTAASTAVPAGIGGTGLRPAGAAAQASNPGTRYCQDFVGHLSTELGVHSSRMEAAMANAARKTLDDAVRNGDLTSQQATSLRKRIQNRPICNADLSGIGGAAAQAKAVVLDATATALGTTPDQVRTQLSQGRTVSQIAPPGMTEQQFAAALQTNLKTALDAQVKEGSLSQAQEDQIISRTPALAEHLWTKGAPTGMPKGHEPSPSPAGP
jgi:hypothetical protein